MTQPEFLAHHGWRYFGRTQKTYGYAKLWDHPEHQPNRRGGFTTTNAVAHQKEFNKSGWCDCIKRETPASTVKE